MTSAAHTRPLLSLLLLAGAVGGCAPPPSGPSAGVAQVRYRVEFTPVWTRANFPLDYPDTSLLHRPHFSGWIGVSHDGRVRLYADGQSASPGLEALAETGRHQPMDEEIRAAIRSGHAAALVETGPLRDFSRPLRFEITVDRAHPHFTAVSMLAPSPDWFVGVDTDLMRDGAFLPGLAVPLQVRDAGSDSGTGFFSDDIDTVPKQAVAIIRNPSFLRDGRSAAVGTLTFTRL